MFGKRCTYFLQKQLFYTILSSNLNITNMKNLFTSILFVVLSTASFSLKAQWFNDNMGSATSGTAPCPWVNTGPACNPAGVTNLGVCATGTSSGNPAWTLGVGGQWRCLWLELHFYRKYGLYPYLYLKCDGYSHYYWHQFSAT